MVEMPEVPRLRKSALEISYAKLSRPLGSDFRAGYLSLLPERMQQDVQRYKNWRDRHARLFGRLLLAEGLRKQNLIECTLDDVMVDKYGRAYIDGPIDFNLSHSGDYVACCLTVNGRVGVDIEQVREIHLADFKSSLHPAVWKLIDAGPEPTDSFFSYWTKVESVLKADGRGMSLPTGQVLLRGNVAELDGVAWHVHDIEIDPEYRCSVAVDCENPEIKIVEVDLYDPETARSLLRTLQ